VFDLDRNRLVDVQTIDRTKRAYKVRLYFKDFASGSDHITLKVRVDVTEHDRIYLPLQDRQLIHPYSDATTCATAIHCVKLEEALADKLKCLLQRRHCFDLFDLVYGLFISREIEVDRSEIMSVFLKKTIFSASPPAAKRLLAGLPFDVLRSFWDKLVAPARTRFSFDRATELLLSGLDALFSPFGSDQRTGLAFYPPEFRNLILTAGSERRLLKVRYHGADRLIEPYSLVYKTRRDGVAQEYFFAYDVTGGNSGPGIKTFLHYDVQNLQLTDESFEPRFEVELAKAGDASMVGIFVGSPGPRPSTVLRWPARPTYNVVCSSCGKTFHRVKAGTRLNPHQDRAGFRCFGGWGQYA